MLVDGPRRSTSWSSQGRLEGQAPDIDPVVYLTDCDPADDARREPHPMLGSSGASGYDLVAPD